MICMNNNEKASSEDQTPNTAAADTTTCKNVVKHRESKTSVKYMIALDLLNKILTNMGKEEITDLYEFVDIYRDDIMEEVNKMSLSEMENEIFKYYNKDKCGYYRKTKNYIVNCIRSMIKEIGYQFCYIKKDKVSTINGKTYRRTYVIYSIK